MQHRADRRQLLGSALAVAAAVAMPALRVGAADETIVIVGAGLAGLVAAHRLRQAGRRVILLEARQQPGGRVRTLRAPFAPGHHGEAGPARIADNHDGVLHWVGVAGLELVPFAPPGAAPLLVMDRQRAPAADLAPWALHLRPDERGLTQAALLQSYLRDLPADLADPDPDDSSYRRWAALDRLSWPDFLGARGASPTAVRLLTLGADAQDLSALYVLRQIALHRGVRRYYKIAGGMDRLPRRLAARLGGALRYGHAVRRIDQGARQLRITCRVGGQDTTIDADRLVLALPFSLLRHIDIVPGWSPAKRAAIAGLGYYAAVRILMATARPPGGAGWVRTDRPAELWDAGYGEADGMLSVTLGGRIGLAMNALATADCLAVGQGCIADAFPDAATDQAHAALQRWALDPWSRGAYAACAPGEMARLMPAVARPEGRIHFAGEHTSAFMSWMEGAVRSGERVAAEIRGV